MRWQRIGHDWATNISLKKKKRKLPVLEIPWLLVVRTRHSHCQWPRFDPCGETKVLKALWCSPKKKKKKKERKRRKKIVVLFLGNIVVVYLWFFFPSIQTFHIIFQYIIFKFLAQIFNNSTQYTIEKEEKFKIFENYCVWYLWNTFIKIILMTFFSFCCATWHVRF